MKLYYAPGACSLAPHIALREANLPYTLARVDLAKHAVEDGRDYRSVNPKGYVPTLELDDSTKLTEASVVLQYIADRVPGTLAPALGTMERYRLMEWLNFIASEIHKGFGPLWDSGAPQATHTAAREKLAKRFAFVEAPLSQHAFVTGSHFTIADAYLFTVTNWSDHLQVDLARFPALRAFMTRVGARPSVRSAMREEGLHPTEQAA